MTDDLMEITNLVSRQLNLPTNNPSVGQIAARIHTMVDNNPALAAAGPEGIKAVIWAIMPEDPAKMDPAKQAEAMLARANITSGDSVAWAKVLETYRSVMAGNFSKEDAGERKAEAYLSVVNLREINETNFAFTEFATRAGLNYGTFSELRSQGFSALQIMNAASFTKEMGLDLKKGAVVVATLQRDLPNGEAAMRKMRDNERDIAEARRQLEEDEKQGASPEKIARDKQRIEQLTNNAQQYYQQTRRSGEEHKPGTGTKVDQFHGWMQDAFGNNRSVENAPQADREVDKQIRGASKPENPSGRPDYKPLQQPNATPTKAGRAAAQMVATTQANVADTQATGAQVHATNTADVETKGRKEIKKTANDDTLALLKGDDPEPKQKAAELAEPARPVQTAQNIKAKPNPRPTG